ncbi:MAG: M20/M25/M40 family metallo-hydrolase [Gemmatimonadales bacterium]
MRRLALACCLALATAAQAQLSETEQRIVAAVKERSPAALDLLERSVRINSGTLNTEGVREVGKLFRAELDGLGFATRWVELPPEMKRGGHLVATRQGTQGKRLLLLGHIDTVFEPSSKVIPWDRKGDRVRGQGVGDMKGGDVIMVEALRALQKVGALDGTTIAVMMTGDEEASGSPVEVSRAPMVELAKASDLALSFEGITQRQGKLSAVVARRSSGGFVIDVKAKPGHSSRIFTQELGYGAIFEAARILDAFRQKLIEPNLTFSAGVILGGTDIKYDASTAGGTAFGKTNVIPKEATIRGNIRYLTPEQGAATRRKMEEIVATSLTGTSATLTMRETYPPMAPTEANHRLLDAFSKASVDAGLGAIAADDPASRGAGDVQFTAPYVPGLDGLGADGEGAHTDNEDLDIASIERGAIRAAILIYRLTRP